MEGRETLADTWRRFEKPMKIRNFSKPLLSFPLWRSMFLSYLTFKIYPVFMATYVKNPSDLISSRLRTWLFLLRVKNCFAMNFSKSGKILWHCSSFPWSREKNQNRIKGRRNSIRNDSWRIDPRVSKENRGSEREGGKGEKNLDAETTGWRPMKREERGETMLQPFPLSWLSHRTTETTLEILF